MRTIDIIVTSLCKPKVNELLTGCEEFLLVDVATESLIDLISIVIDGGNLCLFVYLHSRNSILVLVIYPIQLSIIISACRGGLS
jgi:hypothetical protein